MLIKSVAHKGLRKLIEDDDASKLDAKIVPKLRRMIAFLQDMGHIDELKALPHWGVHQLTGNLRGTWSLSVTANWRLTFKIENDEIVILNLEDYH